MTTINVEQRHIDEGVACDSDYCAVALAVDERLVARCVSSVAVDEVMIYDKSKKSWLQPSLKLPQLAVDWIAVFDAMPERVQPFAFDLDIPQELLKSPNPAPAEGEKDVTD